MALELTLLISFLQDAQLRDNPPRPPDTPRPEGIDAENPMVRQLFKYNFCRPETLEAIRPIRELLDRYPEVVSLAEVTLCDDSVALASEYVKGNQRFHLAYHSALLADEPMSAALMKRTLERTIHHFREGGGCWIVGNHDYGRLRGRAGLAQMLLKRPIPKFLPYDSRAVAVFAGGVLPRIKAMS